jgi:hypothetical protein
VQRKITEAIVKKILLAAALTAAVVTGATAQTYYDPSPRDPPFGKGNPGNDTYHLPSQTDLWGPVDTWGVSGPSATNETSQGARVRRAPVTRTW